MKREYFVSVHPVDVFETILVQMLDLTLFSRKFLIPRTSGCVSEESMLTDADSDDQPSNSSLGLPASASRAKMKSLSSFLAALPLSKQIEFPFSTMRRENEKHFNELSKKIGRKSQSIGVSDLVSCSYFT
jgi:hypothetical protein